MMPEDERNFLDHYFSITYTKLEADALLFNRKLTHRGLVGSENENAIAAVIRDFLPQKFGVEVNALVIDKHGHTSRQCDIVIYDSARFPTYFRKVFPVEIVYAVIEVKTSVNKTEADSALENLASISLLDFRPLLTPYWETRTREKGIHHHPPNLMLFAYRTSTDCFETFARWFPRSFLAIGVPLKDRAPVYPESRTLSVAALDQGVINMESTNAYVQRFVASAGDTMNQREFITTVAGKPVKVDPAKALFLFMFQLWCSLDQHKLHPGFDIRSYMSPVMDSVIEVPDSIVYAQDEQ